MSTMVGFVSSLRLEIFPRKPCKLHSLQYVQMKFVSEQMRLSMI